MKNHKIVLGLIGLIFIVSCEKESENITIEKYAIEYSVQNSWLNYNYAVQIDRKGNMRVKDEQVLNDYCRVDTFLLNMSELDLLRNNLESLVKINLNSEYGFGLNKPSDLPITKIVYETDVKTDSTFIYYPDENELPNELELFFETLVQVISDIDTIRN